VSSVPLSREELEALAHSFSLGIETQADREQVVNVLLDFPARLEEAERNRDDWKRQAEVNAEAIDREAGRRAEAERERDRYARPWLCDCHTWPDPDETHAYIVALETRVAELREALERIADPGRQERDEGELVEIARAALAVSEAEGCVCGEPNTPGVVHRTDGPCHEAEGDKRMTAADDIRAMRGIAPPQPGEDFEAEGGKP
jgi:hypothetical protein